MMRKKPNRWTKSWLRHYQPSNPVDFDITPEEIMADLDPGWALFQPRLSVRRGKQDSQRPDRAA
jgi:hypothetical protein